MIKLHLGCGKRDFGPDWIHIDKTNFTHIKYQSVTDLSQFEDNSVDVIYACHLIAYFDIKEILMVLHEWKRVLKPGGILRLATPDFWAMTTLYKDLNSPILLEDILGPLYGKMYSSDGFIYHKTCYDFNCIYDLLSKLGFQDIKRYDWRKTEHAEFDDHSQAYLNPKGDKENGILISLNIECIK